MARCICSKTRVLREAGINKLNTDLAAGSYDARIADGGARDVLTGLIAVLKRSLSDKISNVFLLSMQLAQTVCTKVRQKLGAGGVHEGARGGAPTSAREI